MRLKSTFSICIISILLISSVMSTMTYASGGPVNRQGTSPLDVQLPPILAEAKSLGLLDPETTMNLSVVLPSKNPGGLSLYLAQLYDPTSSLYHKYLTPQQYNLLYGSNPVEASALAAYFKANGMQAALGAPNSNLMQVKGTARQIENAFKTQIKSFDYKDQAFYSPASLLQLPSEFSNIQMVYGIENYSAAAGGAKPMYLSLNQTVADPNQEPGRMLYYTPAEIKQLYNATSLLGAGYTGEGVTIAIVDAFGNLEIQSELDSFDSLFGLPSTTVHVIGSSSYNNSGWAAETALDVEWAHAMAPSAKINLYVSQDNGQSLYEAVQDAVNSVGSSTQNNIISISWGLPENDFGSSAPTSLFGENHPWLNQIFQQAASQGITVLSATGDWGAYDQALSQTLPYGGASYPGTDPYVTGVGGTSAYMNTTSGYLNPAMNATGTWGSETAWSWNNYYGWSTQGGYSSLFSQPSWQTGKGITQNGARGSPDVAWDGDPLTGVLVYFDGDLAVYGGTSVGAPSWAGIIADVNQKAGVSLGLINPALYSIFNNSTQYEQAFHDITVGNDNPDNAGVGWDPLTGMGTPNVGMLANYLAPTGELTVSVQTNLTDPLTQSYSYNAVVGLSAQVMNGTTRITSGTVTANITSNGAVIASNIALTYNATANVWQGTYPIKSTDPPNEWTATVYAVNGGLSGAGYATFSVGDGVTIMTDYFTPYVRVGKTVEVAAEVTSPDGGSNVSSGTFTATFTLNTPSGKVEGTVSLTFNPINDLWVGAFKIPQTADQGAWVYTVSGRDSQGNQGSAYTWLNVGLRVSPFTDSPSYVLGDTMTIYAFSNGYYASTSGSFNATISLGSNTLGVTTLNYNAVNNGWVGTYKISESSPAGFYNVTVAGSDGMGNWGSAETIVRVAPSRLTVEASVSSATVNSNVTSPESDTPVYIYAQLSYPNGSLVTVGSVKAFVSLDSLFSPDTVLLTYHSDVKSFVGYYYPPEYNIDSQTYRIMGNYAVTIQAYDPVGNYGNATTNFVVTGISHSPITINNDSDFTSANGVLNPTSIDEKAGSLDDPFLISDLNVTEITIGPNVTAAYELFNNWVEGSDGNGITLNTPLSTNPLVAFCHVVSNGGNGLFANNVSSGFFYNVVAENNALNGILIANDSQANDTGVLLSVAVNNTGDGIAVEGSHEPFLVLNYVVNNTGYGINISNSNSPVLILNAAEQNSVGIGVSGGYPSSWGESAILANSAYGNGIGFLIDGSGQSITSYTEEPLYTLMEENEAFSNNVGIVAQNQAVIEAFDNDLLQNNVGMRVTDSLPIIVENNLIQNMADGLELNGDFGSPIRIYVNLEGDGYYYVSSLLAYNFADQNGDPATSTGSGFLINGSSNGLLITSNYATASGDSGFKFTNAYDVEEFSDESWANNVNGFDLNNVTASYFSPNGAEGNLLAGIKLNNSADNTVCYTYAYENLYGILLSASTGNIIAENLLTYSNAPAGSSVGAGIFLSNGSTDNAIYDNTIGGNDAGLGFTDSWLNSANDNLIVENTYGIYVINGTSNDWTGNSFTRNSQNIYPNTPSVAFLTPSAGATVNGVVSVSWAASGQALSGVSLSIDGVKVATTTEGGSYSWNTTLYQDGVHTLTLEATNSGGFSQSATLYSATNNQYLALNNPVLTVQALTATGAAIPDIPITVTNSSQFSKTTTTDSQGQVQFISLSRGEYSVSGVIESTLYQCTVNLITNVTVVFEPTLSTPTSTPSPTPSPSPTSSTVPSQSTSPTPTPASPTPTPTPSPTQNSTVIQATAQSGSTVQIQLSGNITSSQISNATITTDQSASTTTISFTLTGQTGTTGFSNMTIPKSAIPYGTTPVVLIDGQQAQNQSYTQDNLNFYVSYEVHFSTHQIQIQFTGRSNITTTTPISTYYIIIVVVVAIAIIAGLVVVRRNRKGNPQVTT